MAQQQLKSTAYKDGEYQEQRKSNLGIIPKSSFLSALSRNSGMITNVLASAGIAVIVAGLITVPIWGVVALGIAALGAATFSAYTGFLDEKMSKTAYLNFDEERKIADARVNAHEIAVAMTETLGKELKDVRQQNVVTHAAVADLQHKLLTWQQREANREGKEPEKVLH